MSRRLVTILLAAAALAVPTTAAAASNPTPTVVTAQATVTTPGIQVGPPLPTTTTPSSSGGAVSSGGSHGPAWWKFWDVSGQISNAIDDWFRSLVKDALTPALKLVATTLLSTPQLVGVSTVNSLWLYSLGVADSLLVLVLVVAGAVVMTHETLQTSYALKDAIPRVCFAAITANASLAISAQLISIANALAFGFLTGGLSAGQASQALEQSITGPIDTGGIFLILLGLACAVFAVVLLCLYIARAAIVVVLVCAAPLLLLGHALPLTEGLARFWWRAMTAALGVQVAQAFLLATAVRVFFSGEGHTALGLSVGGSLVDLLVALCLLYLLVKVPLWAKGAIFGSHRSLAGQAAKTYVAARIWKAA